MTLNSPSLRVALTLTVLAMGFITLALVIYTGQTYQNITLDSQKQAISNHIRRDTAEILEKLDDNLKNLGLSLQHEKHFRKIFTERKSKDLSLELNSHFHQYFVTAGILDLEKIYVYDINFNLISESSAEPENKSLKVICPDIIKKAKPRKGADRLVTLNRLCEKNNRAFFTSLVPIGGLIPKGYMQIVANPVHDFKKLDRMLATPITITHPKSGVIYQSENWPSDTQLNQILISHYKLHSDNNKYLLTISSAQNLSSLNLKLDDTRNFILIISSLITFSMMILSFIALKKSTLKPIKNILKQVSEIHKDKDNLGNEIKVTGAIELKELALGFNNLMTELQSLYRDISNNNRLLENEVAERKSAEHALLTAHEELEDKIRERTIDLERVTKEAQKANNAKSDFLSRMSHELRTPLNAILGYAELLLADIKDPLSKEQKYKIEVTQRSGMHLLSLINEILDLSSIESGKITMTSENIQLDKVVNETLSLIVPIATKNNISINTDFSDISHVFVNTEHQRLKQVLLNLMTNAIIYNNENGSVTLNISLIDKNTLKINVADTGIGIAKDQIDKLFLPFNRLEEYKSRVDGTGIGLAITKSLVELMDGEMGVESEPGKGSDFWISLPYTYNETVKSTSSPVTTISTDMKEPHSAGEKILVVEDDEVNLDLVTTFLSYIHYDYDIAENGLEAIEKIKNNDYPLVLMDLNMPVMDGIEASLEIRKLDSNKKDIIIIALTANAMKGDKEKCLAAGMNDYLAKPVSVKTLKETLKKWLPD